MVSFLLLTIPHFQNYLFYIGSSIYFCNFAVEVQLKTAPQKTANLEAEQMLVRAPGVCWVQSYKNNPMVEKKSAISYESIMKDLKARKYSPVYVLMGEEPFI